MKDGLKPYITFSGNCEDAINHYKAVFNGEIVSMVRYKDGPKDMPGITEDKLEKIMHAHFKFEYGQLMMADGMLADGELVLGNNISLSVGTDNVETTTDIFNKIAAEGMIIMPFEPTFWGDTFGIVLDKFGISWMFNCAVPKE